MKIKCSVANDAYHDDNIESFTVKGLTYSEKEDEFMAFDDVVVSDIKEDANYLVDKEGWTVDHPEDFDLEYDVP